ncbi:hypothetical protein [Peribacillus muralis]|uniref:hypothetical protein n=1 Tax=Peribacillus muralis TaxID=264697 RepID=UPI003CFFE436
MAVVVFEYTYSEGVREQNIWKPNDDRHFAALVKCYVKIPGEKNKVIEKPSTRPATFQECCMKANKLKKEYGNHLKALIIWNMDEINSISY